MIILSGSGGAFEGGFLTLVVVLVAIFAIALFVIFLRKNTFPILNLLFIRIFRGKYSFEYLEFFKKNNLRNPLNNCIRDEITLHFSVFFKRLKGAGDFTTTLPIEFKDVPFLTSYRKLVKEFGTPHCINIARFERKRVKVVGYNETFHQKKMKSLFYFIEDEFVMGEFVFSETRRMDPTQVKEALSRKYLDGKELSFDSFYIENPRGNVLNYHDNGFFASVKYLYREDTRINDILNDIFAHAHQNGQAFKKAMIQEELLNRF
ncbi:MAG: hypothetical protein ISS17_09030 [Bacteroidales bacterium]|nr:hypothetical protein [Deltaproteobacteria bacterium]MBL7138905.1 hypothetical protein [Bacteroidales bacterium]